MSAYKGVLMWGIRVVIPPMYIPEELHAGHVGRMKMKGIARSYVYWPYMDKQLENLARSCSDCAQVKKLSPTSLHPGNGQPTMNPTSHRFCQPVPKADVPGDC